MNIDENIIGAINNWISHGLIPGSCTELLLRGDYEEAFKHAHPLIKPHWKDHIEYIERLPMKYRGENFDIWKIKKKLERQNIKIKCPECGGRIRHERLVEEEHIHEIDEDGNVITIKDKDNTSGSIYCSNDRDHEIPDEMFNKVMDIIEASG